MSIAIDLNDDFEALKLLFETLGDPCNDTTDCYQLDDINQTKFNLSWDCTSRNNGNSSSFNNVCILDSCINSTDCIGSNEICWDIKHCDDANTNTMDNGDEYQLSSFICLPNNTCSNIANFKHDNNDMVCNFIILHYSI